MIFTDVPETTREKRVTVFKGSTIVAARGDQPTFVESPITTKIDVAAGLNQSAGLRYPNTPESPPEET